jgi:hypothetical protein
MRTPEVFLAYAPRGAGLRCALAYLASGRDVYGWFTGPREDGSLAAAFFLIEDFYTNRPTRYEAVDQADLHCAWSLSEARRHELARMQEAFSREWLVHRGDPQSETERARYGVQVERLSRFSKLQPNWTYYSPRFERPVLRHLAKRWPLEFRAGLDDGET